MEAYDVIAVRLLTARHKWNRACFDVRTAELRFGVGSDEWLSASRLEKAAQDEWAKASAAERSAGRWG